MMGFRATGVPVYGIRLDQPLRPRPGSASRFLAREHVRSLRPSGHRARLRVRGAV